MIVYLDTSALVKLYVEEEHSDTVRAVCKRAHVVSTSVIAYVEVRATFARVQREGYLGLEDYRQLVHDFEQDWPTYFVIEITETLVHRAGNLAEQYALRAYDALHLGSASVLQDEVEGGVLFGCFDSQLLEAAEVEGMRVNLEDDAAGLPNSRN